MIHPIKTKRYGRFHIPFEFINDKPEKIREVMGNLIIIEAKVDYATKGIIYIALSDLFEEIGEGIRIPDYNLTFENGKLKASKLLPQTGKQTP